MLYHLRPSQNFGCACRRLPLFLAGVGSVLGVLGVLVTEIPWHYITDPRAWSGFSAWWPTYAPGIYDILANWGSTGSFGALIVMIPGIIVILSIIGTGLTKGVFSRFCWIIGIATAALLSLYCLFAWFSEVTGGLLQSGGWQGWSAAGSGVYLSLFGYMLTLYGLTRHQLEKRRLGITSSNQVEQDGKRNPNVSDVS